MSRLVRRLKMAACRLIWIAMTLAGYLLAVSAGFVVALQCLMWLRDGEWPEAQVRLAWHALDLPMDPLPWLGVEKIRAWVLDLPLVGGLLPLGGLAFVVGTLFMVHAETYERDKRLPSKPDKEPAEADFGLREKLAEDQRPVEESPNDWLRHHGRLYPRPRGAPTSPPGAAR